MRRQRERAQYRARLTARVVAALLAICVVACDDSSDGSEPDADLDADAAGLGFGEACLRNPFCESRMCLVLPGADTGHCTRTCAQDGECADVAGWVCGEVGGSTVCVPGEPELEADADADAETDADGCPEQPSVAGGVTVFELLFPVASYNRGNASAHFGRLVNDTDPVEPEWSNEQCAAYVGTDLDLDLSALPSLDAGTIQVSGAKLGVRLTRDPFDKTYSSSVHADNADLFGPGSTIRVEAAGGGDIAAYALEAPTPSSVQVTHPRNNGSVGRASDLTVTWAPSGGGTITVLLVAAVSGDQGLTEVTSISCATEDEDGQLRIPAAALATLSLVAANAAFSVTRARADGDAWCDTAVGLTVSTSFTGQVRLVP